jgi:hypothetical protein
VQGIRFSGLTAAVALGVTTVMFVVQSPFAQASILGLKRVHDPRTVTYSVRITTCHAGDGGKLPDHRCTPGSIDPAVNQNDIRSTICKSGWTATVRPPESQTEHAKYRVAYPAYHIRSGTVSELDHLVPLELGGSNDITNLWPEAGKIPNPKDSVENALKRAVCSGKVSLAAAQNAIAANWTTAEARASGAEVSAAPVPASAAGLSAATVASYHAVVVERNEYDQVTNYKLQNATPMTGRFGYLPLGNGGVYAVKWTKIGKNEASGTGKWDWGMMGTYQSGPVTILLTGSNYRYTKISVTLTQSWYGTTFGSYPAYGHGVHHTTAPFHLAVNDPTTNLIRY